MAGRKKLSSSNRRGMVTIAGIVTILLVSLCAQSRKLSVQNAEYESQKYELEQQIKDEELRSGEIENLKEYINSDEYIEKIAREQLGLVYPHEILFQAED